MRKEITKMEKIEAIREKERNKEEIECTFKPKINRSKTPKNEGGKKGKKKKKIVSQLPLLHVDVRHGGNETGLP